MAKKTVAVTEETYRILVELKQKMGCRTMDETVRRLAELSKKALAVEALEHVRSKQLSREEVEALAKLRERLREEGVWLRRS
ncbi:MAG: hypothetical protein QXF46_06040 [Thermofilaceae archaeon]